MDRKRIRHSTGVPYGLALILLLTLVTLIYSNRVDDLDLWWHLKTGERILASHSLPDRDPFSYTTGATVPLGERDLQELGTVARPSGFPYWGANLTQSWLGQVLFYLVYATGGFSGIGLLKTLTFVLTFLVLFFTMRRKGAGPMAALMILALTALIGHDFSSSRPQIFSFLGLAVLFFLFSEFKGGGRKFMVLPLLFLVWSNIHGGYVIGACLLLAFWAAESAKYLLHAQFGILGRFAPPAGALGRFSLITLLSLMAMALNPNHYKTFLLPFAVKGSVFRSIEEYARPMLYEYHAYWFMLGLALFLALLLIRDNDPTDLLLVALLAAASQMGIRAIILFALGAAPFLAASLTRLWQLMLRPRPIAALFHGRAIQRIASWQPQLLLFIVLLLVFGWQEGKSEGMMKFSLSPKLYPAQAVAFLQARNFPGRLLNPYNWGGYLIWQYPQQQVFIDGRSLDEMAYFQYGLIVRAQGGTPSATGDGQPPLWKRLLDGYNIQVILINAVSEEGIFLPLVDKLAFAPEWALVYQDGTALVFLRDTPENRNRFGNSYLDKKKYIADEVVSESLRGLSDTPATAGYYLLLGSIYLQRREITPAREMFEKYLKLKPNDITVIQYLNMIRQMRGEAPLPVPQRPASPHPW